MTKKNKEPADEIICPAMKTYKQEGAMAHNCQVKKMEALGQLAGGVAHDFNNILMIIDGFARMAAEVREDEEQFNACLERIRKTVGRGAGLTRKLLTFGRHNIIEEKIIDLGTFIREHEELLRPLVSAVVKLDIHVEEGLFIDSSDDALSQILMNLVTNARDALADEKGAITIKAHFCPSKDLPQDISASGIAANDRLICLSVTDNGIGIEPKILGRIIDPFFTTKEQGKGTGLGLSMVYGIVHRMKGYLNIISTPGQGTTVSLYLPLSAQASAYAPHQSGQKKEKFDRSSFKGQTILLVEDEDDLRDILCRMFERAGMNVLPACNGNDALLKQHEHDGEINFLLSDIVMPELDGIKLAALLRDIRPTMQMIFMSGYPARNSPIKQEFPKDSLFLAKPVKWESLLCLMSQKETRKPSPHWDMA